MGAPSHFDGLGLNILRIPRRVITEADVPDADIVIATWWETAEWASEFSEAKGRKVYFVQGHEVFDFLPVQRAEATYRMPFEKIVVSGWLQRIMAQTYGDTEAVLIPNAIDHNAFYAPARGKQAQPTVGFMFSPGSIKGAEMLLSAVRTIRSSIPNLRVLSFGTHAPDRNYDFTGIEFSHRPPTDSIRTLYASCDVWLCGSRSEGFGLPAIEAMGCRTPVVSTPVGWAADEIRDGVNGFLVNFDDAAAMADAALKCIRLDEESWRAMSENACQSARKYKWSDSERIFEATLKKIERMPLK